MIEELPALKLMKAFELLSVRVDVCKVGREKLAALSKTASEMEAICPELVRLWLKTNRS